MSQAVPQGKYYSPSKKDEAAPKYRFGQRVRLIKDIRNDGTFPFAKVGDTLMKAGEEGYIKDMGDFLQVIRVYEVEFIAHGIVYGCREEELMSAEESDGYDEVEEEMAWLREHRAQKASQTNQS
jgi:nitrogen fixation protein NifZ